MDLEILNDKTEVGTYFVANYPPFSEWSAKHISKANDFMDKPLTDTSPVGLYIHIPFCRKRCKFCYFRVYTDKNSNEVETYLDALGQEVALYADRAGLKDRHFEFVYFGGGTPSFLSEAQLQRLVDRIAKYWNWEKAKEVTFECEPGTLKKSKLETIKAIGVTRLSLGVEHFDDHVLELNGRAHKSPEIIRAYDWAREVGFDQINIDLIAGMVGDTTKTWEDTVSKAVALDPDSVTIYQMELPRNTTISHEMTQSGTASPVADWPTKRAWTDYAFRAFEAAGYVVSSGYTLVKPSVGSGFVYRDSIWHGADMIGMGVASFSHFQGVHYQNADKWEDYIGKLQAGELPLSRAMQMTPRQALIRELVLQLKLGRIDAPYFQAKFDVDVLDVYADVVNSLIDKGFATVTGQQLHLSRQGLLRVDGLLPAFFEPQFQGDNLA